MPGSATPTSGPAPVPPHRPAAPRLEVHSRQRSAPPRALLGGAQPGRLGPDQDSTPGTSRSTSRRGRECCTHTRGAWGTSSNSRFALSRALSVLGATSEPCRRAGTRSGAVITSHEKLLTPHGATLPLVRHPPGSHTVPKPRAGETSVPAPIPHRTKMSVRVTGQPPPRPTPAARAASAPGSCAAG